MFKLVPALLRLCTCLIRVMPAGLVLILLHPVVGVPIVPLIESPPRQARVSLSADAGAIFDPKISPQCFFGAFSVVSGITYLKTIYRNISACKNKQMIICVKISALPICPTDFFCNSHVRTYIYHGCYFRDQHCMAQWLGAHVGWLGPSSGPGTTADTTTLPMQRWVDPSSWIQP